MKKTITVLPNSNQLKAIETLMKSIGFKEIDRFITGGLHSATELILTFEGDEKDYHENEFVKISASNDDYYYFFSLSCTDGYYTNDLDVFKKQIKKSNNTLEIHKL